MKAPGFWYSDDGILSRVLSPLGAVYGAVTKRRMTAAPADSGAVVVCIGNIVAGGAGKTPVALAVADILRDAGHAPHFLLRGYGGAAAGPLRVDLAKHDAAAVGDEALLLAASGPAWVSRDRLAGARAAAQSGAQIVVMDDGFQNPHVKKDVSILVVDGGAGFGNGRVIPAGPLREPVGNALARADAVVIVGEDTCGVGERLGGLPVFTARVAPDPGIAARLKGKKVLGFAGIGRPEKFRRTLEDLGATVAGWRGFADHHPFTTRDVENILNEAREKDAIAVTTAKDAVRLPEALRDRVTVLPVTLEFDDAAGLRAVLTKLSGANG